MTAINIIRCHLPAYLVDLRLSLMALAAECLISDLSASAALWVRALWPGCGHGGALQCHTVLSDSLLVHTHTEIRRQ